MNKVFGKKILWTATALWAASAVSAAAFEPDPFGREPDKAKPYAELEPSYNITSFMDAKPQPAAGVEKETDDIYFSADEMIDNKDMQTITAVGDVNIIRKDQTLKADKVIYNQKDDIVTAVGNVSIVQADGTVVFSDYVELDDKMTKGHMTDVRIIMKDETRIAASKFRKMANDNKVMENVVYSPCDVCRSKDPLWQIKARKVKHDAKNQDVYYNDAFIEVKGVPVFYTPFLSHPDPSVKRRSGFIAPTIGSSSYLGGYFQPRYFWNISDHEDLLFAPMLSSDKGIVWNGEYRKYFYKGDIDAQGSFLTDEDKDKNRGNLFLKARYEINDFWLADTDINYASDSLYLKDLSLPYKDNAWLTSRIRLQGFDNRNYASAEAYYYKLVSYNLREADKNEFNRRNLNKPFVAPLISYENISDVGTYGAYTKTNLDFASVYREDDVSTQRASMRNSWVLPYTSPYGEKYRMVASVKSDLYYVDNYTNEDDQNFTGGVARVFPQVGLEWRLPFVRATENSRQILEPVIVAVAAPNGGNKADKIPNEDSQDIELSDSNVLDLDRYPGYDRNDTGSRISYGINWSSYGNILGRTSAFIAQSYKFNKDESFTQGIDEDSNFTDYVGRIYAAPADYLDLTYRFRLDKDTFDINYSELGTSFGPSMLRGYISYIYLQRNDSAAYAYDARERKELYTSLTAKLTRDWSLTIYNRQDLAPKGGSIEHGAEIIYEDECLKLITDIHRYHSNDPEYEGNYEFSVSFLLKTLGGFGSK